MKTCAYCDKKFISIIPEERFCSQICREKQNKCQNPFNKKYNLLHINKLQGYSKKYRLNNLEKIRKNETLYRRRWYKNPINKLIQCYRNRLRHALKGNIKIGHTKELIECNIEFLRKHLECQFIVGMTWGNYGTWHIDHIRPCASFDLSLPEEQRKCFHYSNLQPLWAKDNSIKSNH
jgi:hypothetical protein